MTKTEYQYPHRITNAERDGWQMLLSAGLPSAAAVDEQQDADRQRWQQRYNGLLRNTLYSIDPKPD